MTWDSVDLPEPFGPMIAWTSPRFTVSESPWRISRSSTRTCRSLTSSSGIASIFLFGIGAPAPAPLAIGFCLCQRNEADGDGENRDNAPIRRQGFKLARYNHRRNECTESQGQNPTLPGGRNGTVAKRLRFEPELVGHGHYPTLPSSEIEISFCASTANSIGSCCSTSLTKPLTTRPTASSWLSPRCTQ